LFGDNRYWDSFGSTERRVATALANLQTFDLIGHKELFDEFITGERESTCRIEAVQMLSAKIAKLLSPTPRSAYPAILLPPCLSPRRLPGMADGDAHLQVSESYC